MTLGARLLGAGLLVAGLLGATLLGVGPASADTNIEVRVSVKIIRNPVGGQRPSITTAGTIPLQDSDIFEMSQWANDSLLIGYWRGYRFRVTEIVEVGTTCSSCSPSNPSYWYGTAFNGALMSSFESWAKANPSIYQWRTNAVNLYFNYGHGNGAVASFPPPAPPPNDLVVAGSQIFDPGFRTGFAAVIVHHELGHYFNLAHPNAELDTCCVPNRCIRDGDGLEETLPDAPCFTLDQLSSWRWGLPFNSVDAAKQDSLWNTFWNNMTYLHPGQTYGQTFNKLLVESQLDRWTDTANGARSAVRDGRTWFVSPGPCTFCIEDGSSALPYHSISSALVGASGADIVLLRPGTHTFSPLLSQPVTLRATRKGAARITN